MRRSLPGPLALVVLTVLAGAALASFSTTGAGTAAASITTLSVPSSPTASSGDNVSVTWSASTIAGTVAATSYVVERYTSGGSDLGPASCSPVPASSGTPNAFGSFSCTDSPGAGTYEYKITARYNGSWTAASGFTNTATARNATTTTVGAPGSSTAGVAIASGSISATLAGAGAGAGGTVTFTVFGPQASAPTSCGSGGTAVGSVVSVSGAGTYHPSAGFTPSAAGTYWWYASYGGDANNAASNSTCGSGMTSTVAKSATTTTVGAPGSSTAGVAIASGSISATLAGAGAGAGGTVTFTVFGPQASAPTSCGSGGTAVGSVVSVSGAGTYHPSAGFTPSAAGTYWWYASYGGDANNAASNSTCGSGMTSTVAKSATTTTVGAPGSSTAGVAIASGSISATLAGAGAGAGGTVTFTVFGPQASAPTSCGSGGTAVGSAVSVSGAGTYHPSAGFTPSAAGTYWWYASYGGDANNAASNSTCGSGMTSTVAWTHSSVASATDTTALHTATTTSSFTVKPSAVYLLLVFRHSRSGDGITSISSTGLSPSLSTSSFTSLNSHTFNTSDYQWAYVLTTGSSASGTGTLTVSFTKALGASQAATLDLVQVQGGSLTTPVVTANEGAASGSSAAATANLPSAPAAGDSEIVFLGTSGNAGTTAPTASPAMANLFYSHQTAGSAGVYSAIPAQQNESLTLGTSQSWGTLGFELAHG